MNCRSCSVEIPAGAKFCAACGAPVSGTAEPAAATKKPSKALLTVLIVAGVGVGVLFCGGIFAAIAIPNLLNAIDRGKQKRTMADMRSIGVALENYRDATRAYPVGDDLNAIRRELEPNYIRVMPTLDGWSHPIRLSSDGSTYELVSGGKDGERQGCDGGTTDNFKDDICFADGEFTQWPDGTQR